MKRLLALFLSLALSCSAFGANELNVDTTTGLTVYVIGNNAAGQAWNGAAFATYTGTLASFDIAATETTAGSGRYFASMPGSAGYRTWTWYQQSGGSPLAGSDAEIA